MDRPLLLSGNGPKLGQNGFQRLVMMMARTLLPLALVAAIFAAQPAQAQFPFGSRQQPQQEVPGESDLSIRVGRLEAQLRELTGQIEQLQYQNQQLQQQLQTLQGGAAPAQQKSVQRPGDAFDPNQNPNAPGSPRNLGQLPQKQQGPLVLSPNQNQNTDLPPPQQQQQQAPAPVQQQQAVLPPSNSPKDAYDLAYGYVLRRDYALAEQSFRAFLDQHAGDRNAPVATYWLGESLFQQKKYSDAANVFLEIYKQYPQSQRAPDSLLRLGQSLAQLGNKEGACGSLGAVVSKYPKASANLKKSAADEQKRLGC